MILHSPNQRIRITCSIDTLWIGNRVYPEVLAWEAEYRGQPAITRSFFRLKEHNGETLAYGMKSCKLEQQTSTPLFSTYRISATDGKGQTLSVLFVLSDDRLTYAVLSTGKTGLAAAEEQDFSLTTFPQGAVHINPSADFNLPHAFFTPHGKIVAYEQHPFRFQAWLFDRPGDLATAKLATLQPADEWKPESGKEALTELFTLLPFWQGTPASMALDDTFTPAFREALAWIVFGGKACEQEWMMRGEPGDFAILARRQGKHWQIAGISSTEKTLTIRLEDLWDRTPADKLPAGPLTIKIIRDPNHAEKELEKVTESFPDQPRPTKIVLEVKANGGFLIAL